MLQENDNGLNCQYRYMFDSLEVQSREGIALSVPVVTQWMSNGNGYSGFKTTTYFHFPLLFANTVLEQIYCIYKLNFPHIH